MGLASNVALTEGSRTIGRWDLVESPCSLSFSLRQHFKMAISWSAF